MTGLWTDLLRCLDLDTGDTAQQAGPTGDTAVFDGVNLPLAYRRLFGGQLLAQFVRAADAACPAKVVKSLHAVFGKEGHPDQPVRYEVTRQHEGRTFAALSIVARQPSGTIATASVSLHAIEDGPDHQAVPPPSGPPGPEHRVTIDLLPWETRTTIDLDDPACAPPEFELWMRTPPVGADLAPALAAYATDLSLIGTALRPVDGVGQRDAGTRFSSAVTSHTVWFHRPFRTDGWLLLRQHSPFLGHGRCFGRGDLLGEDGSLLASYAQEALLRFGS